MCSLAANFDATDCSTTLGINPASHGELNLWTYLRVASNELLVLQICIHELKRM